ncbi:unnamed protein product [Sympodiomycopsis kandeliae]
MSQLSDEEELQRFGDLVDSVEQAKDVEEKVSALHRLEADLPSFTTIPDPDRILHLLKLLVKHPHALLSNAALTFSHAFLPLLHDGSQLSSITSHTAKIAVTSLMSGLLERTGDARERTRESAARGVEEVGKLAIDSSITALAQSTSHRGKEQETPLQLFERYARENGLMAKSAKIREQCCKILPHLRSYNAKFPIKLFLAPLVDLLADADPFCREASKATLISLFVKASPGAKSDLKKELDRKNVRKPLADLILKEVLGSAPPQSPIPSTEQLSIEDQGPPSQPTTRPGTSMAVTAEENIAPVYIASRPDLERSFASYLPHFEGKETEHNWQGRETSVIKVRGMLRANVHDDFGQAFTASLKALQEGILKGVSSLRTTLATQSIALVSELAARLGDDLDTCIDAFVPALLKMAGFTKRIVAASSQNALGHIFRNVSYRYRFMELLWSFLGDKTVATRVAMMDHLHTLLATHAEHRKHALEHHDGVALMEKMLKKGLADQHPEVRAKSREAFFIYQKHWTSRANLLVESLDSTAKKQLASAMKAGAPSSTSSSPAKMAARPAAGAAAGVSRRPGGPSNAILAAKRAASARMSKDRRSESDGSNVEDAIPSLPSTPRGVQPKSRIGSLARSRPISMASPSPASIPLPQSPPGSASNLSEQYLLSPTKSRSPEHTRPRTASIASSSSSSNGTRKTSSSIASPLNSTPSNGSRHLSASSASNGPPSRSLKARSVADFSGVTTTNREGPSRRLNEALGPPRSRFVANTNPDDTVQLDHSSSEADATMDLMGNTSALRAQYGGDDSITFSAPPRVLNNHNHSVADDTLDAGDATADETIGAAQLETESTPRQDHIGDVVAVSSRDSNAERSAPATISRLPDLPLQTPQVARPARHAGTGWFQDRAERLDAIPMSPFKSKPAAMEWVQEIRDGKADVKTFRQMAKLCGQFRVVASGQNDSNHGESQLEPGAPQTNSLGLAGRMSMQEDDANVDGDDLIAQQTEAWQDNQLFEQLWNALKRFLTEHYSSASNDEQMIALMLLQKLIEYQHPLFISFGLEPDLVGVIFQVQQRNTSLALLGNSCEAILDSWTNKTVPALGLHTIVNKISEITSTTTAVDCKTKIEQLGLRGISNIITRLPTEVIEEELSNPLIKNWIRDCYTDPDNVDLRQAAVGVLTSANNKVQNPQVCFDLVGPLRQDQMDLLTYYFAR